MIVSHDEEKLLNAITYFLEKTSWFGITKLFKLLYFLDFEHYQETGRSVTGQDYFAWKMGPVPVRLRDEIDNPDDDFLAKFDIEIQVTETNKIKHNTPEKTIYLKPKSKFDPTYFTKREIRLLNEIASRYAMNTAAELVEYTHLETEPWHKVWEIEKRKFDKIPYEYSLIGEEKDFVEDIAKERLEVINNYK